MTPEERQMLSDLANKIARTPPPPKDTEAEEFIRTRIGSRPDALYLMTQTVLIQNLAIEQAQQQIEELKQQAPQAERPSAGSFLGTQAPPRPGMPSYSSGQYGTPPPPQYGAPSPSAPSPGGGPSFLRGAAQTAAGVAAGALAFEGIRSLFSHPGYGGAGIGGFSGVPVEETVVNNYYDTPPHEAGQQFADAGDDAAGQFDNAGQIQDASYDDAETDDSQFADADYDLGGDGGDFGGDSGDNFA